MFEIYFNDLTKEAQEEFLKFMNIKDAKEGNYDMDIVPIATVEYSLSATAASLVARRIKIR